jgi:hypothetical protein
MSDGLSEFEARLERVAAELSETERHIMATGLSLDQFEKVAQRTGRSLDDVLKSAVAMGQAAEDAAEKAAKAAADTAAKAAKAAAEASAKAGEIFAKGVSSELPEKLRDIARGFELAGSGSLSFADRARAGAGALAIAGRTALGVVGQVVEFAQAVRAATDAVIAEDSALSRLNGGYERIAAATHGAVSAQEAFNTRIRLIREGVDASTDSLQTIEVAARNYARAMGMETAQAVEIFIEAAKKADNQTLRGFNARISESRGELANLREAMRQVAGQEALPPGMADRTAQANAAVASLGGRFLALIDPFVAMRRETEAATEAANEHARQQIAARTAQEASARAAREHADAIKAAGGEVSKFADIQRALNTELNDGERQLARMGNRATELRKTLVEQAQTRRENRHLGREMLGDASLRAAGVTAADIRGATGMGGGGTPSFTRDERRTLQGQLAEALHAMEQMTSGTHQFVALQRMAGESVEHYARRTVAFYQEQVATTMAIRDQEREKLIAHDQFENERHENYIRISEEKIAQMKREMVAANEASRTKSEVAFAQMKADQERNSVATQASQGVRQALHMEQTVAEGASEFIQGAMGAATASLKAHYAAVITGREDVGTALKGMLQDVLVSISTEAFIKSLFSFAQAAYATATGAYPVAAQYATAGIMYAGVAAATGVGAFALANAGGGGGSSSATASGGGSPARVGPASMPGGDGGATSITININGTVMDREGTANALVGLLDDASMRGRVPRATRQAATRRAA